MATKNAFLVVPATAGLYDDEEEAHANAGVAGYPAAVLAVTVHTPEDSPEDSEQEHPALKKDEDYE